MILQRGEYDFKIAVTTPYVFESKNRWIIFLIHLHFLNIWHPSITNHWYYTTCYPFRIVISSQTLWSQFGNNGHMKSDFHRSIWNIHRCHSFTCILWTLMSCALFKHKCHMSIHIIEILVGTHDLRAMWSPLVSLNLIHVLVFF